MDKLVIDYINGEDIENIDALENNPQFMLKVIKRSKDKNMYNLCSDNVKKDYNFVKKLIKLKQHDIEFVNEVATFYLENVNDDINNFELCILISNIIGKHEDYILSRYYEYVYKKTNDELISINKIVNLNEQNKLNYQKGFIFIMNRYGNSTIIKNYYAKIFLNEIFYKNQKYTFEALVHQNANSADEIKKSGISSFFINYIENIDTYLKNYLITNIELLNDVKKDLYQVFENWEKYEIALNKRRILIINQELETYLKKENINIKKDELIGYVISKLGYKNIYEKYSHNKVNETNINENKLNLREIKCLKYTISLIDMLYKDDVIDYNKYENEAINKTKAKILELNFKKQ